MANDPKAVATKQKKFDGLFEMERNLHVDTSKADEREARKKAYLESLKKGK